MSKHYTSTLPALALAGVLAFSPAAFAATLDLNIGGSASSTSSSSSVETTVGVEVEVARDSMDDVEGSADTESGVAVSASGVSTSNDLRAYARTAIRTDERVEGMNFAEDRVEVKYKESGRFLALLPVTFTVSARAHANGEVEVDYPWYSFLTIDNHDKVETEMKVAIDSAMRSRLVGSVQAAGTSANPTFNASESAMLAAEMHRVLKANFNASATAEGDLSD